MNNTTIGLTQFVFLALGSMALHVITKVTDRPTAFAAFLVQHSWWLVIVPAAWVFYDQVSTHVAKGVFQTRVSRPVGALIAAGILVAYAVAIFFPGQ